MKRLAFTLTLSALVVQLSPAATLSLTDLFGITESDQYLIIATKVGGKATESDVSNFEIGSNKAPVPSTDKFLNPKPSDGLPAGPNAGQTGGPTLAGAVPTLPANAQSVFQGIGGHGNIAVIDPQGEFNLQNVGVYADPGIGIRVAAPKVGDGSSINKASNAFFNEPNHFPNTFNIPTQSGIKVEANGTPGPDKLVADQSTRIDASGSPGNAGVTYGFDHTPLKLELDAAKLAINGYASTGTLNLTAGNQGELGKLSTLTGVGGATLTFAPGFNDKGGVDATITLQSGLNVIDIFTGAVDKDFLLNNSNLVIDGPSDSKVIFRLADNNVDKGINMLISNSNILAGTSGIDEHSILFFTDQNQNDTNFNFQNSILNAISFWALGPGSVDVDNSQGCVQFVADLVNLQDVRYNRCAFEGFAPPPDVIPEPSTAIFGVALSLFAGTRSRGFARSRARSACEAVNA